MNYRFVEVFVSALALLLFGLLTMRGLEWADVSVLRVTVVIYGSLLCGAVTLRSIELLFSGLSDSDS